jgi:peroxiredoxin
MTLALGSEAPDFRLTGVDGREHTLESYGESELLALIQACNHCPYVLAWEGRMIALQRTYGERGLRIVTVNSNDADRFPEDSFERMVEHASQRGLPFDYLHDRTQTLARALGSERTPEVFLFDRDRRLVYHGAIDDNRDDSAVQLSYVRDAIDALLGGEAPPIAETAPVGCSVKWLP